MLQFINSQLINSQLISSQASNRLERIQSCYAPKQKNSGKRWRVSTRFYTYSMIEILTILMHYIYFRSEM
jgi:hypothetical protein